MKAAALILIATLGTAAAAQTAPAAKAEAASQGQMNKALVDLRSARAALEAANSNKGGHRRTAIEAVDKAIAETKAGIDYSTAH